MQLTTTLLAFSSLLFAADPVLADPYHYPNAYRSFTYPKARVALSAPPRYAVPRIEAPKNLGPAPALRRTSGTTVHVVQVSNANGSLAFFPENVQAEVGSVVQFQFHPKNHSVVQSTFAAPCVPMQNVQPNATNAFFSGFMPASAAANSSSLLTYSVKINDTNPIWFYCSQGKHCQAGMVGAINAATSGTKTVAAFKQLAGAAVENLSPGQTASVSSGAAATPGSSSSSSDSTPGADSGSSSTAATSSIAAAQQTTNAAPGALGQKAREGVVGVVGVGLAAFLVL